MAQIYTDTMAENRVPYSLKVWIDETNQSLKFVRLGERANISESSHLSWLTQLLNLSTDYTITLSSTDTDVNGITNYKYHFLYDNREIALFKYQVSCKNGEVVTANGDFYNGIVLQTTPIISELAAYQNAIQYMDAQQYMWEVNGQARPLGTLMYYPQNGNLVLAYYYVITSTIPLDSKIIYVNASTGSVFQVYEGVYDDNQPNTTANTRYNGTVSNMTSDRVSSTEYRLREYNIGTNGQMLGIETYNMHNTTTVPSQNITDFWDSDNLWNNFNTSQDEVATDVHWGIERAYDFYWNRFNRNSWDNNGMIVKNYVHYGMNLNNAQFFHENHYLAFGDGDGINNHPFTSLEIVGHEYTHGVTHFTAGFNHNTPGDLSQASAALDESFCDIFGISLERETHPESANYTLGDLVSTDEVLLRDISNPKHYSKPDTYFGEYMTDVLETECHALGMIQSHWFYLLANGGEGQNDQDNTLQDYVDEGHYYNIKGIGTDEALQIAYRNFSNYLGADASFDDARFYSIESAIDLFGECSPEHIETIRSWDAVGVYNSESNKHNFITIKTNQTWSGSNPNSLPSPVNNTNELWINGSLCVDENISLSISNVKLKFGISGKIILKEGATLVLDNVIIDQLSDCICNWQGLIYVGSGAHLEINDNTVINMPMEGKIIIERGGRMSLTNSSITTNHGNTWLGIELHGNSNQIQNGAYQGILEINNGIIENAVCAVKTYKPEPTSGEDPLDPLYTGIEGWSGGMVLATNATFRNNRMGVLFTAYERGSSSYFDDCSFETTAELIDGSKPDYFIRMNSISGVQFFGCSFRNTNPDPDLSPENRGSGIYAYDATVVLSAKCNDINCTTFKKGSFDKLYYGIRDLSSGGSRITYIDRQNFLDNFRGVYFSGRNYVDFTRNYIRPYAEQTTQNPQTYGVYFDQCTGYHIEDNTFNSENTNKVGIGLIVHKSGKEANEVYRNVFHNLRYASIAQSFNRGTNNEGLCYKCNDFFNNLYDVKISLDNSSVISIYDGIAAYQGYYAAGNNQAPAGNLFSDISNAGSISFYNSANSIYYFKHQLPVSVLRLNPENCQGQGVVNKITVLSTNYTSTSCPSKLELGDNSSEDLNIMAEATSEASGLSVELESLIDGGNTDALTQSVVSSTSAQSFDLHNELLASSPYLTDTVLEATIQQEDALPNVLLRDVLVANPQSAKSDRLLEKLDNRQTPMPNNLWNEIMAGASVIGDKENKEAVYGSWKNEEYYRWSRINRRMLLNQILSDSIIEIWNNSKLVEARLNLALYYLTIGNADQGIVILDSTLISIPSGTMEWNEIMALRSYIQTIAFAYPNSDTAMIASFEALMSESNGLAEALSRNVLIQSGAISYCEPILVDDGLKSGRDHKFGLKPVNENNTDLLTVYPNPAKEYFMVNVKLSGKSGILSLITSSGEVVKEKQVDQSMLVTLPVDYLSAGIYILRLTENGVVKANVKVTLQ